MATFTYSAKRKNGQKIEGTIAATDRAAAVVDISAKGLAPIWVREQQKTIKRQGLSRFLQLDNKVKLSDKVIFSRQFATMINAGIPITQSLVILSEQTQSKKLKKAIAVITKKVEGGGTLSEAMSEFGDIFTPVYINAIKAGEAGGILDQILDRLATQQEKDAEIVSKVRGAMIYPSILLTVTIGAFFFLMTVIVPKLAVVFESLQTGLPIYTRILLGLSKALTHYGVWIIGGTILIVMVLVRYFRTKQGKQRFDRLLLKLPIFGSVVMKVNVARFARIFGSLMSSGLGVLDALNSTRTSLSNTVYQNALTTVAEGVKAGKPLSQEIKQFKDFPPIVAQMMAVGEETGQLDAILFKLADFYEKEVDNVVSNLTSVIEPILIVVLGGMVGLLVVSIFGPLSQLTNAI